MNEIKKSPAVAGPKEGRLNLFNLCVAISTSKLHMNAIDEM